MDGGEEEGLKNKVKHILTIVTISALFVLLLLSKNTFLICCFLVLFEKCIIGRVNPTPIGGIEFTTMATILTTLKYGLEGGLMFFAFLLIGPAIGNAILGDRWVVNPDFNPYNIGFGILRDFASVFIVHLLHGLDLFWIFLIVFAFKNFAKIEGFGSMDIFNIPISFVFNLLLLKFLVPIIY